MNEQAMRAEIRKIGSLPERIALLHSCHMERGGSENTKGSTLARDS